MDDRLVVGGRALQSRDELALLGDVLEQKGHIEQARGDFTALAIAAAKPGDGGKTMQQEILFVLEVVVKRCPADVGAPQDVFDRGSFVALFDDQVQ